MIASRLLSQGGTRIKSSFPVVEHRALGKRRCLLSQRYLLFPQTSNNFVNPFYYFTQGPVAARRCVGTLATRCGNRGKLRTRSWELSSSFAYPERRMVRISEEAAVA